MKNITFFSFMSILFISVVIVYYANYVHKDFQEFEELRLAAALDYACDAAVEELIESKDLKLDYATKLMPTLDPDKAIEGFLAVMAYSYGFDPASGFKEELLTNCIPVAAVLVNDGWYLYQRTHIDEDAIGKVTELKRSIKKPYKSTTDEGTYWNMLGESIGVKINNAGKLGITTRKNQYQDRALTEITESVMKEVNEHLQLNTSNRVSESSIKTGQGYSLFFNASSKGTPLVKEERSSNRFEGPTFLVTLNNLSFVSDRELLMAELGGAKITPRAWVVGYKSADGVKYYSYVDENTLYDEKKHELFESIEEAAKVGYWPDLKKLKK